MAPLHLRTHEDLDPETLAQTALEATGGGTVTALARSGTDPRIWRASVVGRDRIVRDVHLDVRLRSVTVAELGSALAAA
jgi:hypothetical protein